MTLADDLPRLRRRSSPAGSTDEQLAELIDAGQEVAFAAGDELFREGEPADYLWILLEGSIELYRRDRATRPS